MLQSTYVDTLISKFESLFTVFKCRHFRCRHFQVWWLTLHSQIQVCFRVSTPLSHMSALLTSMYLFDFFGFLSTYHFKFFKRFFPWICMIFNIFDPLRFMYSLKSFTDYSIKLPSLQVSTPCEQVLTFSRQKLFEVLFYQLSSNS